MRRGAWLVSLGLALGACGPAGRAAGGDAASGDALELVLPRDAEELDPRFVADPYGLRVSRLVFASLVTIDPRTLEVVPDLAERIELVSDVRYRVVLREGLRFSDGSALDAEDVVATFRSVVDPALGSRYARTYERIAEMTVVGPREVVFELDAPHATFLTDLELPIMRAQDARARVGRLGEAPPVGAGPYVLAERRPGRLLLEANGAWHHGAPRFPRVRMTVVHDDNTRALRLRAGSGDLAVGSIPPLLLPLFEQDPRFEVTSVAGVGTTYLGLNLEVALLSDVRVRRALAHALDRPALVRAKLGGRAELANGWIPPGHWAHDPAAPGYAYDPERARRLLDEAGVRDPDGAGPEPRARLTLRASSDRQVISQARAIAAMLREVGVEVEVRPSEKATLIADLNAGRFEATLMQVPEVFEPHVLSWFFASDRIPREGRTDGANRWRMRDAALDAALERGRASPGREARVQAYAQVQRLLGEQLPVIPLWHEHVVAVAGPGARGFEVPRDGRFGILAR